MTSTFRNPRHEQDEVRMRLYALAQPHEPTAYEERSDTEVKDALAFFETDEQHRELMLKAEALPQIMKLVRACKTREYDLETRFAERLQQSLRDKEVELENKYQAELKDAKDDNEKQLNQRAQVFVEQEQNLRRIHAAELKSIHSALSGAAASRGIIIPPEGESSAIDRLKVYIKAFGSSSKQSEARELQRVEEIYQATEDRVREHMTQALVEMKLTAASGQALEAFTVSFIGHMSRMHQDLKSLRDSQLLIDEDITDAYKESMNKDFRKGSSCETKVSVFTRSVSGLVSGGIQQTRTAIVTSIRNAFGPVCTKVGIEVNPGTPEECIQQLGVAFDKLVENYGRMLQDTAVILDNGTALLDLDLDLSENNPINVKVEEFTKEVYAQLEKSRKDREKAIRKFCDLDNWVTGFTQSARDSSNRLRLAIKEDATGREQILTSYMTSLEFWYSKHTAMHKSVRKQINDTSTTLGIDISSKSSTSPTEKTKLLLDGVTKLVRDNDTKANVRLSSLVEVMRSALYVMKATIPSDVTPEAFFSAYHDHANSLVDLLSSETGSIEHSADEVTGALSGKRIIFQDRIAQNTRLHNENLQKLHENYGACIVEMIKSIHSDTLSFQGLVYPEEDVPDLELRPDMSLEAASANAHAAKTWVFACAGTIGTALTGRKVQVEQLALDLAGRINSQRSLLKDYIELKGDLQDSMQLANDLGVQVTRLTGA